MTGIPQAHRPSRRQVLRWGAQAAVAIGTTAGLPGYAEAATGGPAAPAGPSRPARQVRDLLNTAPPGAIALTIDDGPHPLWTPQVLDLLRQHGIPATFSLIGMQARASPGLVKRILAEGHSVANHSMTHPQPFGCLAPAALHRQIADAQSAITEAGGVAPALFRAPGGDWSAAVLSTVVGLQLRPLGWDVDPRDWSRPGTALITHRLLAAQPGDILLCHDGGGDRTQTLESLRTVLPALKARGLRFVRL